MLEHQILEMAISILAQFRSKGPFRRQDKGAAWRKLLLSLRCRSRATRPKHDQKPRFQKNPEGFQPGRFPEKSRRACRTLHIGRPNSRHTTPPRMARDSPPGKPSSKSPSAISGAVRKAVGLIHGFAKRFAFNGRCQAWAVKVVIPMPGHKPAKRKARKDNGPEGPRLLHREVAISVMPTAVQSMITHDALS